MPRRSLPLVALALALALPTPAGAANIPFTATLSIELVGLLPVTVTGSGVAIVNGSGGGGPVNTLGIPAAAVQTTGLIVPATDPGVLPIMGILLNVANGAGAFAGGNAVMPLQGVAKVCLYTPCDSGTVPANLSIPLAVVGQGGAVTVGAAVNLTVVGAPWTTGTASIGTYTRMGFREGPLSGMSSTAAPSGQIQLVTPIFVSTNISALPVAPVFARLSLHFVPEPATLGLFVAGLVGLGIRGRQRMRDH